VAFVGRTRDRGHRRWSWHRIRAGAPRAGSCSCGESSGPRRVVGPRVTIADDERAAERREPRRERCRGVQASDLEPRAARTTVVPDRHFGLTRRSHRTGCPRRGGARYAEKTAHPEPSGGFRGGWLTERALRGWQGSTADVGYWRTQSQEYAAPELVSPFAVAARSHRRR